MVPIADVTCAIFVSIATALDNSRNCFWIAKNTRSTNSGKNYDLFTVSHFDFSKSAQTPSTVRASHMMQTTEVRRILATVRSLKFLRLRCQVSDKQKSILLLLFWFGQAHVTDPNEEARECSTVYRTKLLQAVIRCLSSVVRLWAVRHSWWRRSCVWIEREKIKYQFCICSFDMVVNFISIVFSLSTQTFRHKRQCSHRLHSTTILLTVRLLTDSKVIIKH